VPPRHPVFDVADRYVERLAAIAPIEATFAGIDGYDDRWGDLSVQGLEAHAELVTSVRSELDQLPPGQHEDDQLAVRALADHLDPQIEEHEHGDPLRDLAHLGSTIPSIPEILNLHDPTTDEGRAALIGRLSTLPAALADWRRRMRVAVERDVLVASRQVESVVGQLRDAVAPGGGITAAMDRLTAAAPELTDVVDRWRSASGDAAEATARWLEQTYLPRAPERDAVGPERYQRALHGLLGTDLDLEETSAWAWEELRVLLERATTVAASIDDTSGLRAVLDLLRHDPRYAVEDPHRFRDLMQERQTAALEQLEGTHFDVPGTIRQVDVRLAPPGGALGAYYIGPSEDLSRPGSIWWSLGDAERIPLFEEITTAYHEGFPGHHLQVGLQVTFGDRLTRAHRLLIWNPGYGEGWALYAETLMDELGELEQPAYELGYLTSSILRLLRVVIDIGLHLEHDLPRDLDLPGGSTLEAGSPWTFDRAVAALTDIAALADDYAVSEVTRYLGWPGQAISYAVGQREILRLREARRQRDGRRFDLRTFHADVLGSGPVGLDHLGERVRGTP